MSLTRVAHNMTDNITPTGVVLPFAGSAAPTGWLVCDGSAVSRTTYASLFSTISTSFGAGDGSTTFNLPDMRGRTPVGVGTGTDVEVVTSQTASGNAVPVASNNARWITGMPVTLSSVSGFTGITAGSYFLIRDSSTSIRFASTLANAQNGTAVTVTGTGSFTMTRTLTARTLGERGGEESHAMSITELLSHTHANGGSGNNVANGAGAPGTGATSATGGNAAMNVMNPFVALNYIIKF